LHGWKQRENYHHLILSVKVATKYVDYFICLLVIRNSLLLCNAYAFRTPISIIEPGLRPHESTRELQQHSQHESIQWPCPKTEEMIAVPSRIFHQIFLMLLLCLIKRIEVS